MIVFGVEVVIDKEPYSCQFNCQGNELRLRKTEKNPWNISAEKLRDEAQHSVADEIKSGDLSLELSVTETVFQNSEKQKIESRFVKLDRMDGDTMGLVVFRIMHSQKGGSGTTIAAAVDETAHTAQSVSQSQTGSRDVEEGPNGYFVFEQIDQNTSNAADHAAKIDQSAVAVIEDLSPGLISKVVIPISDHKKSPGTHQRPDQYPGDRVEKLLGSHIGSQLGTP